jgi:hypothetical protein
VKAQFPRGCNRNGIVLWREETVAEPVEGARKKTIENKRVL